MALSTYCPMTEQFNLHRQTPILMVHGKFDTVLPLAIAKQSAEALTQRSYAIEWHQYPMEHQVCVEEIAEISKWLIKRLAIGR
jgi:phospholipase/carboxylesterase